MIFQIQGFLQRCFVILTPTYSNSGWPCIVIPSNAFTCYAFSGGNRESFMEVDGVMFQLIQQTCKICNLPGLELRDEDRLTTQMLNPCDWF